MNNVISGLALITPLMLLASGNTVHAQSLNVSSAIMVGQSPTELSQKARQSFSGDVMQRCTTNCPPSGGGTGSTNGSGSGM